METNLVINSNDRFCVDARQLWLKLHKPQGKFADWIKRKVIGRTYSINDDFISIKKTVKCHKIGHGNKNTKEYLLTIDCAKQILTYDTTEQSIELLQYLNSITQDDTVIKVIKQTRKETTFFNKLMDSLEPLNINIELQKPMFNNKYRIDGYIEDLKLAIEYDEGQHYNNINHEKDMVRQKEIKDELGCKFVRLNYKDSDAYNIGVVMKNIFM